MNLDGIDVFVKVVQTGSFTQAAKALGMPITTVSGKVAALEKKLGVTLLHRTTRKLNTTQAGGTFFQHCLKALEEIQAGEGKLHEVKAEPEGLLRITTVADLGHSLMVPLVKSYLKEYPKMNIELILTNRVVDLVGEGVDLGIRFGKLKDSTLIAKKFRETPAGLWASPSYLKKNGIPSHPRDLKKHQFIRFPSVSKLLKLYSNKESFEVAVSGRIIVDDMETVKAFVLSGDGIGLMPNFLCEAELAKNKLVNILPAWGWGNFALSFVYPPQRFVSLKVQSFISWVEKHK